jgi:hypothetical protein
VGSLVSRFGTRALALSYSLLVEKWCSPEHSWVERQEVDHELKPDQHRHMQSSQPWKDLPCQPMVGVHCRLSRQALRLSCRLQDLGMQLFKLS